ncbi:hypothetical protein IJ531_04715, partial [bacterium]|nr:hypothetical protein [bacterium]
ISNTTIYHFGSLSVTSLNSSPYIKQDKKTYRKYTLQWYQFIFHFERLYKGFRIILFGLEITYHTRKSFEQWRKRI